MNWKSVFGVYGFLLILLAVSMLLPMFWALYYGTPDWKAFALSVPLVGALGLLLFRHKGDLSVGPRESYLIVAGGWVISSLAAALPYVLSGVIPNPVDAVFESVSGFTTTGATIMPVVEVPAAGVLFWRSYLHWLGGMGIILIFLAFVPKASGGGAFLFRAEVPGPEVERLTPRLRQTASSLLAIYGGMTVLETVLLCVAGMSLYDALIHAFGSVATGGFSNKNLSVGAYQNPWIHYIILIFMLLAGMNFSLFYKALTTRSIKRVFLDKESQLYLAIIVISTVIIAANVYEELGVPEALHHGSFQVVSVITTTGYITKDFDKWPDLSRAVLLLLMFVGPCSGSTGGSVKVVRYLVIFKSVFREIRRMVHAKAVLPLRIGDHVISENTVRTVLVFTLTYLGCALIGTFFLLGLGLDMVSAVSGVAATLGNIGPGLGAVGPMFSFALVPPAGKILLTFLMLLGRLEIFTVLITLAPAFWR